MPEIRTDDIPVDTSADQVSFIADELDRLAGAAEALEGEDGQTDKMVMFDSHTAMVIAATLRALLARNTALQEQAETSEGMELRALRERDALRQAQADPVAWMVEDLVIKDQPPQFTARRDRAEGVFGDPKEFRVTPLYKKADESTPSSSADADAQSCENLIKHLES